MRTVAIMTVCILTAVTCLLVCGGCEGNSGSEPSGSGVLTGTWTGTLTGEYTVSKDTAELSHEGTVVTGTYKTEQISAQPGFRAAELIGELSGTYNEASRTLKLHFKTWESGSVWFNSYYVTFVLDASNNILVNQSSGGNWTRQ